MSSERPCETVSVIVPVYRVEQYLDRCVRSIAGQTYKDLDIILVDDASPDSCGEICDRWARRDDRIRVIHHEQNVGLSGARNSGIEASSGVWLTFVDSDDWIHEQMIEVFMSLVDRYPGHELYCCNNVYTRPDAVIEPSSLDPSSVSADVISSELIVRTKIGELSLEQKYGHFAQSACSKLYDRGIFFARARERERERERELRYRVGVYHEDLYAMNELVTMIDDAVCTTEKLYFYFVRPGSITQTSMTYKRLMDHLGSFAEQTEMVRRYYPPLAARAEICEEMAKIFVSLDYLDRAGSSSEDATRCRDLLNETRRLAKSYLPHETDRSRIAKLRLFILSPRLFFWTRRVFRLIRYLVDKIAAAAK